MEEEYLQKQFEDLPDEEYYTCYNCGMESNEFFEQESDLFPGESIKICIYCGGWIE